MSKQNLRLNPLVTTNGENKVAAAHPLLGLLRPIVPTTINSPTAPVYGVEQTNRVISYVALPTNARGSTALIYAKTPEAAD